MPRQFTRHTNAPPGYQGLAYRTKAEHINELQIALEEDDVRIDQKADTSAVQGMVEDSVSSHPTVIAAAEDAVTGAIADRPIVEGGAVAEDDIAWTVTDAEGRRGPFEINSAGGLTQHSSSKIREGLGGEGAFLAPLSTTTGFAFAITDEEDRIAFGVRADGSVTTGSAAASTVTRLPITGWGTSMMEGSTGSGTTLLTVIRDELGLTAGDVDNRGVSGMRSPGIAAQQGGSPALLTVEGGTIPASGSVNVSVDASVMTDTFYAWYYGSPIPGTLMGVAGTLDYPAGVNPGVEGVPAVFTRTSAGDAVVVPSARPFLPDGYEDRRSRLTIFWAGHNDQAKLAQVQGNYRAMVDALTHDQYLILGETHAYTWGDDDALNDWLASEFPWAFVDLKAFMVSTQSLDAVGLTPTADDLTDISNGLVPRTLRPSGDVVHFNATGYQAAGWYVAQILTEKGWLT